MRAQTRSRLTVGMAVLAAGAASAGIWPTHWTAFGPVAPDAGMAAGGPPSRAALLPGSALRTLPATLTLGGQAFQGQPVSLDTAGRLDLSIRFQGVERGKTVYLLAPVTVDRATTARLGAGADGWMHWWLDGTPLFDTLNAGPGKTPVAVDNHSVEVKLSPGAHVLAVAVISGSRQFVLAAGDPEPGYAQRMAAGRARRHLARQGNGLEAVAAARAEFQKALDQAATDPDRAAAWLELGGLDAEAGRGAAAEACRAAYGQVLALRGATPPQRAEARWGLAQSALATTNRPAARTALTEALAARPDPDWTAQIRLQLARLALEEGDLQAARLELDQAAALDGLSAPRTEDVSLLADVARLAAIWNGGQRTPPPPADAAALPSIDFVVRALRCSRPRLFLTPGILERVARRGLAPEQQAWLAALKQKVDGYPPPPALDDALIASLLSETGGHRYSAQTLPRVYEGPWGFYAGHAALVYRLTGDRAIYDRALAWLRHAAAVWDLIRSRQRTADGRAWGFVAGLSAYDWLHDDLPAADRAALGRSLFGTLRAFYRRARPTRKPYLYYGHEALGWYLGLAFLGAGIDGADDATCLEMLRDEYEQHVALFRQRTAEPDGVALAGALGYTTQFLPSEINFLDTWRSAVGGAFERYFPKRAGFGYYTLWNTIAPSRRPLLEYGWSDSHHMDNHMDSTHFTYLMRVADLYAGMDDLVDLEALTAIAQAQVTRDVRQFLDYGLCYLTPASPVLMSAPPLPDERVRALQARLPRARHFPDPIGHTFMNSGWGSNDTYALFIAGRASPIRKHYDENHFTLYQRGFLALDSGSQIYGDGDAPGGGRAHQGNYYMDTVAHNAVLIRMEGETLPGFWGQKSVVNTGGMNQNYGARVLGFETGPLYTYIASDATSCYHSNKAAEVVRQFLFVYPDWFVVFDRVESKAPDQKKTWLFHTQLEPVETGDTFRAEHRDGAVCVRTLLPPDRVADKIGGPGREFWADGRNWPAADFKQRFMADPAGNPTPDRNLFGQWRMEITPGAARTRDLFLHLIQVGDKVELRAMTPSRLIEDGQRAGVEFQAGARTVQAVFNKAGPVGGHIRLVEHSAVLADQPLATDVQRQEGMALAE